MPLIDGQTFVGIHIVEAIFGGLSAPDRQFISMSEI
jgi:hypothetical protein